MAESREQTPSNLAYAPALHETLARLLKQSMQAGQFGPRSLTFHVKDGVIQEAWTDSREQCQRPGVR